MSWIIYCHIHIDSGRRYVGLTAQPLRHRWNQHVYKSMRAKGGRWHFPNAIRKYGKSAFSHEILETCDSLEVANTAEEKWISYFDSRNPEKGFNLARGGGSQPHSIRKNPWDDPEYRARQSLRLIALTHTPQARANNKIALNTPESKAKRSIISKEVNSRPAVKRKLQEMWNDPDLRSKMQSKPVTHCARGHEYTVGNTYYPKSQGQGKKCRICEQLRRSKSL